MTIAVASVVLTAGLVAEVTGGRLVAGAPSAVFTGVSIDTRSINAGELFIALRGEQFDGHAFLGAAWTQHAGGVLVDTLGRGTHDMPVIQVTDTLAALQALGHAVRRASGTRVVAITGSAGKTTTKEATAALLATRYPDVFRNAGNLNNHIGLPLSLVALRTGPSMAVVELGMNHAGEIRRLVSLAEPDVRVWTNVGDAHAGHFTSREDIAAAKAEILEQATAESVLVANADDPLVMRHAARFAGRVVRFGEAPEADVRATAVIDRGFDGTEATISTARASFHLRSPLAGRAQLSNLLAATATALELGVDAHVIPSVVATLKPVSRRGTITETPAGVRVVDDTYNASPAAMRAMLDTLGRTATGGRRVAVLGEMRELGEHAQTLHDACGRAAVAAGIDRLVVVGGAAAEGLVTGAVAAGLPRTSIDRYVTSHEAAAQLPSMVRPRDLVLVKGSRGTRMDVVVDRLLEVG